MPALPRSVLLAVVLLVTFLDGAVAQLSPGSNAPGPTSLYFVRHDEVDDEDPSLALDPRGLERAARLAQTLKRIPLTHAFSSHTLRSRRAAAPAAQYHGLTVVPLPPLGSEVEGQVIGDASPSNLAIAALAARLGDLPPGISALVVVNSDNLFAVLNRLGVPAAGVGGPCQLGRTCVPCLDNSCFPAEFDNLWLLVLGGGDRVPVLYWLKY